MKNFGREKSFGGKRGGRDFGEKKSWDRGFGERDQRRAKMHPATCSECGRDCEVPFKPSGNRPVFCSNCFQKDGEEQFAPKKFGRRDFERPSFEEKRGFKAICDACGVNCEVPFRPTGEKPVYCSSCFEKGGQAGQKPPQRMSQPTESYKEEFKQLQAKLDRLIDLLSPAKQVEAPKKEEEPKETVEAPVAKKELVPKKETKKKPLVKKAPAKKKK